MSSTFSALKIELIGTGDQSGTWGATTNVNLGTAIEEAITGTADVSFSNADVTLTLTNNNGSQTARNLRLNLIGTVSTTQNLIVPAIEKQYIINNGLTYAITVKNSTGTGVAVPAGKSMIVFNDGTNVSETITYSSLYTYPGAGIPNSTGSAWGTSYTTSGSGTVVALATGASLTTPTINTAASVGGTWTSAAAWTIPGHSVTGDLTLSGAGYNFSGDFSNATIASRNAFKTSTSNANTVIGALPNGSGTGSAFQVYNNSTPTNASLGSFEVSGAVVTVASAIRGSGTYLPMAFNVFGSEQMRILTTGAISFGSSGTAYGTSGQVLTSGGASASPTWTSITSSQWVTSGSNIYYNTGAVINTRINPRSAPLISISSAPTPDSDLYDQVNYTLTGNISSINAPSGTPVNGQKLTIRFDAASTYTISNWNSSGGGYRAIGTTLPTSVPAGKTIYVGCIYNADDGTGRWSVVAVATQA
jgi:hypothetical protein